MIPNTGAQVQYKQESVTTDADGRATITYDDAFPVKTNAVWVTILDSVARKTGVDTLAKTGFRFTCDRVSDTFTIMWMTFGE